MENYKTIPLIRLYKDFAIYDGKVASIIGTYTAIPRPIKGIAKVDREKQYAVIVIADGTHVFLEPLNSSEAIRPAGETEKYDGKFVCVTGTVHRIMPSIQQSLINPCISGVISIQKCDPVETNQD